MFETDLLDLIGLIYQAATDGSRWSEVVRRLAELGKFTAGSIHFQDLTSHHVAWAVTLNISDPDVARYRENYAAINPWLRRTELLREGCVNTRRMMTDDREWHRTEFWNDWAAGPQLDDLVAGIVAQSESTIAGVTLYRPPGAEACDTAEIRYLSLLMPHLQRAIQLHLRLGDLERQGRNLVEILDTLPWGVVIVGKDLRVQTANRSALAMVAERDGLRLERHEFSVDGRARIGLRRLVAEALQVAAGDGLGSGGTLRVERRSMKRAYQLLVTPLLDPGSLPRHLPSAVIFITDPERTPRPAAATLTRTYGLTPAEARLATLLLQGDSLTRAAERLGVTRNTAKTQLKSIFAKTGTHRQSELVRLLATGPAAVASSLRSDR